MFANAADERDFAARFAVLDPSTTPEEVRAADGTNQRMLGLPSACTYFAAAFVFRCAARGAPVHNAQITPAWVSALLHEPGIAVPRTLVHPDPCSVVTDEARGFVALQSDCRGRATDSVCVPLAQLEERLADWLGRVAGALLVTGTETFGVCRTAEGSVALFDSHGDSTQTQPAVVYVWCNDLRLSLAPCARLLATQLAQHPQSVRAETQANKQEGAASFPA